LRLDKYSTLSKSIIVVDDRNKCPFSEKIRVTHHPTHGPNLDQRAELMVKITEQFYGNCFVFMKQTPFCFSAQEGQYMDIFMAY